MEAIFFPRQDYPVEICAHRLGKSMTYTEASDQFRGGAESIVDYAAGRGLTVGVFWGMSGSVDYASLARPLIAAGKMRIDAYCHPTGSEVPGTIITQDVYEQERDRLLARIEDYFEIRPIAMSYNSGNTSYEDYIFPDFLAGRNSGRTGGTPYGVGYGSPNNVPYSANVFKSKQSTSRWYDDVVASGSTWTFETRLQQLAADVATTKQNGGWYNNFTHWHNVISAGNLEPYKDYIDLLTTLNSANDIYFAGYGEAVAYLVYRQLITRAVMYSPTARPTTQLFIRLEAQNTLGVNEQLLQVPISVKFSTVGTPLEGKTLTSDCNIISLGGGDYIIEIPYTGRFPYAIINGN